MKNFTFLPAGETESLFSFGGVDHWIGGSGEVEHKVLSHAECAEA